MSLNQKQSQRNIHHLLSHSSSVVLALEPKLASMSTELKQALAVRTQNLKQQKSRQAHFFPGPASSSIPQSGISGHHQGSVLLTDEVSVNMEAYGPLLPVTQKQAMIYDFRSRAKIMQDFESTISELGETFQQLARIVKEQEEGAERIDTNVQDAELNVEGAHNEIIKYL